MFVQTRRRKAHHGQRVAKETIQKPVYLSHPLMDPEMEMGVRFTLRSARHEQLGLAYTRQMRRRWEACFADESSGQLSPPVSCIVHQSHSGVIVAGNESPASLWLADSANMFIVLRD